jgi:hypothetical protein
MTQVNPPGYPLPDGELGEDEIVCQLIYLPDRPEYWQALLAAVHYFATWKAWERDDDKRGKDAAANWRDAFELTIGCWRMTCLEELTETVTDILELLQGRKDCCDDNITYLPVDDIETDIDPGVGDPPEVYGETEIADWDEWAEHVCYNAHAYVDYLAHAGDSLWEAAKASSIVIGLVAAFLALLAFSGIGLPIAYGLAAGIVSGIVLGGQIATFAGTREAIEDARDDIVCAIINGTGIAAAVEDALGSGVDWDLFYQFIPYDSAMAIIYEGGHGSDFLPSETRDDCVCEEEVSGEQRWDFNSGVDEPWYLVGSAYWEDGAIVMPVSPSRLQVDVGAMRQFLGESESGTITVTRIKFSYKRSGTVGDTKVAVNHDPRVWEWIFNDTPVNEVYEFEEIFETPLVITHPMEPFVIFRDSSSQNIVRVYWVELDMEWSS